MKPAEVTVNFVIGFDGRHLTLADLPAPDTKRWVVRRKAEVVAAVQGGLLSFDEACGRYALNPVEFLSWQNCIARFGLPGLLATRVHSHPKTGKRRPSLSLRAEKGSAGPAATSAGPR